MNVSNILPSIRYNAGAGSQHFIDVHPTRIKSAHLRIRPKSQYENKMLKAALIQTNSGIVLNQNSQQTFSIGGVKVLSRRFSHVSNANEVTSTSDTCRRSSESPYLTSQSEPNLMQTMQAYKCKENSPSLANRRDQSASLLGRSNIANKSKHKGNTNNSSSETHKLYKGKPAIMHTKTSQRSNKNGTIKNNKNRTSIDSDGKPDFTTSNTKAIKIFLSQKQSVDISPTEKHSGLSTHPSAPPCTPSREMLKKYEYIPSLSDNMAKQQIKAKLKIMKKVETDKEKVKKAEKLKVEVKEAKEREQELRKHQRRVIYLLNAAMTKVENDQFEYFKSNVGLNPKVYPSSSALKRK